MRINYNVPILSEILIAELMFKIKIIEISVKAIREEGLDKTGRVVTEGDIYFNKLEEFALH